MRARKNIQSPWINNQLKQSNLWTSKKLETSCLKDESHGQNRTSYQVFGQLKLAKPMPFVRQVVLAKI